MTVFSLKNWWLGLGMLALLGSSPAWARSENAGLGPLEIRTHYPVTLPFLAMYPENTATLGKGVSLFSYSYTVGNTIMNTEGEDRQITRDEVNRGIVLSDFYDKTTGEVIPGFRLYMDIESNRHLFRFKYGLSESTEISFEQEFITQEGGCCWDSIIENWHDFVNVSNDEEHGNYRTYVDRSGYDYYVVKDGEWVIKNSNHFIQEAGDLYTNFKWNLTMGGAVLPAVTVKLSYKFAKPNRTPVQKLISSGSSDYGYYLLLSKGFGEWVLYFGEGMSILGESSPPEQPGVTGVFASKLSHRFTTIEYRWNEDHSLLLQTLTQSSIFPQVGNLRTTSSQSISFDPSNSTDAAVVGHKGWWGKDWFTEFGFVEDYNQVGNETDIVIYLEGGLRW